MKLTAVLAALMLAAAMAFAACGDDDDDDGGDGGGDQAEAPAGPAKLTITATDQGARGGRHPGPRRNRGHAPERQQEGRERASWSASRETTRRRRSRRSTTRSSEGEAVPDWFRAEGGVGTTAPGKSSDRDRGARGGHVLRGQRRGRQAGDKPRPSRCPASRATPSCPETDASVTAEEYSFESERTAGRRRRSSFENTGEEFHHVDRPADQCPAAPSTDAERFLKTEKGRARGRLRGARAVSTVIDGGKSHGDRPGLKKGNYALVCFVSDRAGGKSHFDKGMISEATVE